MKIYAPKAAIEMFHLIVLDMLGRKVDKRYYALKGGCNLRFFFNSIRYSEDMDIDVSSALSKEKLQDVLGRMLDSKSLEQIFSVKGIRILEKSSPKQTETTQRWKFALLSSGSSISLRTKIEFSRRGMKSGLAFERIDTNLTREYQLAPILASHYRREEAFLQKVIALATRSQIQARDVFDLHLLLSPGIDAGIVNIRAAAYRTKARENVWSVSYDMFRSQVIPFLHPQHQAQYSSPELWDNMVLEVVEVLGGEK